MTAAEPGDVAETAARLTGSAVARAGAAPAPVVRDADAATRDADAAVTEFYAAHYRTLVGLATLLLRDQATAEEVVQDSFVAMHSGWRRLREPDKALDYLRRSVVNRSRSALRHRAVAARAVPRPPPDAMTAALDSLPPMQREALVLRYYAELSPAQIASAMGISASAVNDHAARALSSLRSMLEAQA